MSRLARSTQTLEGRFTQRKRLSLFDSEITTRGKFSFRRPSWFRWETLAPDASVLVVDGDKLTVSSGGASKQMDLGRGMKAFLEDVMIWVGAKPAKRLKERYSMRLQGSRLTLRPKTALRKRIRSISLQFDKDSVKAKEVVVIENNGDQTTIAFNSVVRGQ